MDFGLNYYDCIGDPLSKSTFEEDSSTWNESDTQPNTWSLPPFQDWRQQIKPLEHFQTGFSVGSVDSAPASCSSTGSSPDDCRYIFDSSEIKQIFHLPKQYVELPVTYEEISNDASDALEVAGLPPPTVEYTLPPEDDDLLDLITETIAELGSETFVPPPRPTKEDIAAEKASNAKYFQCLACNRQFQTRTSLKKHFTTKLHHDLVQKKQLLDPIFCVDTWLIKPVVCPACDEHFQYYYQCVQHIYAKHEWSPPDSAIAEVFWFFGAFW